MYQELILDKYVIVNQKLFDYETGEELSKKESKIVMDIHAKQTYGQIVEDAIEIDVELDVRMVKARNGESYRAINIKANHEFTKMFKVDVRDMIKDLNLSIYAKSFMHDAMSYLRFPTNTIVYNNGNPSNKELMEMTGIKKTQLDNVLRELKNKGVIIRKKIDGNTITFVNPFLYSCGLVDENTYNLFKNNVYNPLNK